MSLVKALAAADKLIAAICHGPWTLIEAGVVDAFAQGPIRAARVSAMMGQCEGARLCRWLSSS